MRHATTTKAIMALVLLTAPLTATGDDPLDHVDGTESWDDIDTSAVDEEAAWGQWQVDLRSWEAGRARIEAERARMAELRRRAGETDEELEVSELQPRGQDHQARIDAVRRRAQAGAEAARDTDGQSLDDERPWSSR